jgi:hypothetical protein
MVDSTSVFCGFFPARRPRRRLALDLDGGTVHSTTVGVIIYVARLACRVDAYLDFVVRFADGTLPGVRTPMRDAQLGAAELAVVRAARGELQALLRGPVHVMFEVAITILIEWP